MNIQTGKKYILRNGLITDEVKMSNNGTNYRYEATVKEHEHKVKSVLCWLKNGSYLTNDEHAKDIVSEFIPIN